MAPADFPVVGIAALLLGVVNSVAGGGSLIFFPVLLVIGLPPIAANVTNSVVVLPGFVGAVHGFREELRKQQRRQLVALSIVVGIGAAGGGVLLLATPSSALKLAVPLLVLFASVLLALQPYIGARIPAGQKAVDGERRRLLSVSMFGAAIYGGYFNGALGVIMLGVLASTTSAGLHDLNALKAWLSLVVSLVILPVFVLFGPVHWWIVALGAPVSLIGGILGAAIARKMNERVLRWCVVLVGVSASIYFFIAYA